MAAIETVPDKSCDAKFTPKIDRYEDAEAGRFPGDILETAGASKVKMPCSVPTRALTVAIRRREAKAPFPGAHWRVVWDVHDVVSHRVVPTFPVGE